MKLLVTLLAAAPVAALAALFATLAATGSIPIDDVFRTFYTQMGVTNISQDVFLGSLTNDATFWEDYYIAGRYGVSPQALNEWYLSLVSATAPDDVDREVTNRWMCVKGDAVGDVSYDIAVCDDTNCWFAVAREIGRIRAGFRTKYDWEELVGIDSNSREITPDGVELVSTTNLWSEHMRLWSEVRIMQIDQTAQKSLAYMMERAFDSFKRSQTFKNLSAVEHNAIVSNLVETARMDAYEARAHGFTNIVEQTSSP
jgi:hypothetical protein